MPYFSRLTDIITCSLNEILKSAENPRQMLQDMLAEMQEGIATCQRNVRSSTSNHQRLEREIRNCLGQIEEWRDSARQALQNGSETSARQALQRKSELEALVDGLQPELDAAASTCQNLIRIRKALEARFAEALRYMEKLTGTALHLAPNSSDEILLTLPSSRRDDALEAELEALRQELRN